MLDELETEVIEAISTSIWDKILEKGISCIMCTAAIFKCGLSVFKLWSELIKLIFEGLAG